MSKKYVLFAILCVFIFNSIIAFGNDNQNIKRTNSPIDIINEMLHITKMANTQLKALEPHILQQNKIFENAQSTNKSHIKTIGAHNKRFRASHLFLKNEFSQTEYPAPITKQRNEELTDMKTFVNKLYAHTHTNPLDFSKASIKDSVLLLSEGDKLSAEARLCIDSQYWFLNTFTQNITNYDSAQKNKIAHQLKQLHTLAIQGNIIAKSKLNELLNEALKIYPKDTAVAQYNLGLLYADTGKLDPAIEWMKKAADQGFPKARIKLGEFFARYLMK